MRTTLLAFALLSAACGGKTFDVAGADAGADGATDAGSDAASPDLTRCTGPGTCALVPKTCCGPCSELSLDNMTAVAKGKTGDHTKLVCGPNPVDCPPCAPLIPDQSIQAWCRPAADGRRCAAVDVRKEPVSDCATDADCTLRYASCCEPCEVDPYGLVALNKTRVEMYRKEVCVGDEACPRCLAPYPEGARAYCDPATKHCRIKSPTSP